MICTSQIKRMQAVWVGIRSTYKLNFLLDQAFAMILNILEKELLRVPGFQFSFLSR